MLADCGGRCIGAETAQKLGLIDGIVASDMLTAATGIARKLVAQGDGPCPTRGRSDHMVDGAAYLQAVTDRRSVLNDSHM